jgi:hypothetical protein
MTQRGSIQAVVGVVGVVCLLAGGGCSRTEQSPSPAPVPAPSGATVAPTPATTPVPPPTPGDIKSTLKPRKVDRRKPVALNKSGPAADGVMVSLKSVRAITAKGVGPGEVSGPALRVDVLIRNETASPLDLGAAVVSLTDEDGRPGASMGGPPASPLPGGLKAQDVARGVYVFTVKKGSRNPVTIDVSMGGSVPVVVFRGKADG